MRCGARKYGWWCPSKDKRDLFTETQSELLDVINYAVMQIQKLELMKKHGKRSLRKTTHSK